MLSLLSLSDVCSYRFVSSVRCEASPAGPWLKFSRVVERVRTGGTSGLSYMALARLSRANPALGTTYLCDEGGRRGMPSPSNLGSHRHLDVTWPKKS